MDMIFQLYLEDAYGNKICLTDEELHYVVSKIDGLYPPSATLSTVGYPGADGSYLTNAYVPKRNLVISLIMPGTDIEMYRRELYKVVQTGKYVKVYYSTANRDVWTEGYVESITMEHFTSMTSGTISILCPDIYWHGYTESTASGICHNPTEWVTGTTVTYSDTISCNMSVDSDTYGTTMKITNNSSDDITFVSFYLQHGHGGETAAIEVSDVELTLSAGDYILVTSQMGNKDIRLYNSEDKDQGSLFGMITFSKLEWTEVKYGNNEFRFIFWAAETFSSGDIILEITHTDAYLGV